MTKKNPGDWHYPGNWHVEHQKNGWHKVCDEHDVTVANIPVHPFDPPEWAEANAHLIAAAPDLLKALKTLMNEAIPKGNRFLLDMVLPEKRAIYDDCLAAIAKARGPT